MTNFSNPTGTGNIERAARKEIATRWAAFEKAAITQLYSAQKIHVNAEDFQLSATQIRAYMLFLNSQIETILMGTPEPPNWMSQYILQGYTRGLMAARQALISQGASITPTDVERMMAEGLLPEYFTAIPSFGLNLPTDISAPIHTDALSFLYTRAYESLDGWTSKMATEVRGILMDGVNQGMGMKDIVRQIRKRIDVSLSRAKLVAQTEIIQAYQRASTNEAKRASEELGIEVLMRWLTRKDSVVRHQHALWHGTLATPEDNFKRISVSPYNCRCAQSPVIPIANTKKKQDKFDEERKVLLALESKKRTG